MRVEGQADGLYEVLFPRGLVPQVLRLLVEVWERFERPADGEHEKKINNRFVRALQAEGRRRRVMFRIEAHQNVLEDLNPKTGKGYAEIDICIPRGYEPCCYFAIEAKKLNTHGPDGRWSSNAGEYAGDGGMGCFVSGRYAAYQSEGAMLGYVMDGDCNGARASLSTAIDRRAAELGVSKPCRLHPSRDLPDYGHAFETLHAIGRGEFKIHHVLLAALG